VADDSGSGGDRSGVAGRYSVAYKARILAEYEGVDRAGRAATARGPVHLADQLLACADVATTICRRGWTGVVRAVAG
jgi:hypothetical protein